MPLRRPARYAKTQFELSPLIRRWMLRILVPLNGHQSFITHHGFENDAIAELLGLDQLIDSEEDNFTPKEARTALRKMHATAELNNRKVVTNDNLKKNIKRLAKLVGLSSVDCKILEFAVLIHSERSLDDVADWLGQLTTVKVIHTLSVLLDLTEQEVRASLSSQGILEKSGLLLRPDEVLSGILHSPILKVAHNALGILLQHRHMGTGCFA